MKPGAKKTFGSAAKAARLAKGLGLRQVAREFGVEAAYLSRVENDLEVPSGELIAQMAQRYEVPVEDFNRLVSRRNANAARGHILQSNPELRALYRLVTQLDASVVDDLIRRALKKQGVSSAQIEETLTKLKSELLPRIATRAREGLFAAEAKPRFLSKKRILGMAYDVLKRGGLTENTYVPPTPIELLVETEPGIAYVIAPLKCTQSGEPVVLGQTGWNAEGERQITINAILADSRRASDEHRFNFTLGHELFHAIEHLPRMARESTPPLARARSYEAVFVSHKITSYASPAERAVRHWTKNSAGARSLSTDEDWREWQANVFSSALLMPEWAVRKEFEARVGAESVVLSKNENLRDAALDLADKRVFDSEVYDRSLADIFAVSRQAMAIRLLELALVTEEVED